MKEILTFLLRWKPLGWNCSMLGQNKLVELRWLRAVRRSMCMWPVNLMVHSAGLWVSVCLYYWQEPRLIILLLLGSTFTVNMIKEIFIQDYSYSIVLSQQEGVWGLSIRYWMAAGYDSLWLQWPRCSSAAVVQPVVSVAHVCKYKKCAPAALS